MSEMKTLNGYEIVDGKGRDNFKKLEDNFNEFKNETSCPRALISNLNWYDSEIDRTIVFESMSTAYISGSMVPIAIYGLQKHGGTRTSQLIYCSTDGGLTWKKFAELPVDEANGQWYFEIFVQQSVKEANPVFHLLKTTNGSTMSNIYLYSVYKNSAEEWRVDRSINIGNKRWLSNNNSISNGISKDGSKSIVIWGEYGTAGDGTTYSLYKSTNSGITWTKVLELQGDSDGGSSLGEIRHWHGVFYDPYTRDWWACSGDANGNYANPNSQCRIYRSQQDGKEGTWELIFCGSQEERTCSFVFEEDCIYYGMDAPAVSGEGASKIFKIDRSKLDTDRANCREVIATVDNNYPVYGLTRTNYPEGFIIWSQREPQSIQFNPDVKHNRLVLQFYEYTTKKIYPIGTFNIEGIGDNSPAGFCAGSRFQNLISGIVFARTTLNMLSKTTQYAYFSEDWITRLTY